jgi:site-specific recombinase XerC
VFTIRSLLPSWERSLEAKRRSRRTIDDYLKDAGRLADFLDDHGMPADPASQRREHVESFIVHELDRGISGSTVASNYRRIKQLYRWLLEEGEITVDPMANMEPPTITEKPVPVIPDDEIKALFKACEGSSFEARRDMAINRVFLDTGMRLAEMAGIEVGHIDWKRREIPVHAKGDKILPKPFGPRTAEALDRYLRARTRHRDADSRWLWLGLKGRLTYWGISQVVVRRAARAGIGHINPHRWRHTMGHRWMAHPEGKESDLERIMGWSGPEMARRYGKSAADERAREAHRRMRRDDDL